MASRASAFDAAASCRYPHVASDAGNPEQTGSVVNQIFEHGRVELLFPRQIDQNAGIEIAAPRAHDHAASRGQSHAGIDRYSVS